MAPLHLSIENSFYNSCIPINFATTIDPGNEQIWPIRHGEKQRSSRIKKMRADRQGGAMPESTCLRANLFCVVVSLALSASIMGCTYTGSLEQSFHEAKPRSDLDGGKMDLSAAVVNGPELQATKFATFGGFHGVDIPIGDAIAKSVQTELATIFTKTAIVSEAKASAHDIYVYPKIEWVETYRDSYKGVYHYETKLRLIIKNSDLRYTVAKYAATDQIRYVPPPEAMGAQVLQGASLMVLSPITVPFTTHAIGQEAKRKIGGTISKMVHRIGDEIAEDDRIREYAALGDYKNAPIVTADNTAAASPPKPSRYKRAKSKYDDFLNGVVMIRTADLIGTGFFVSADGYLVTNKHVVGNENVVSVKTRDGAVMFGEVVKRDGTKDLALVKIKGADYTWLRLSNGEDSGVGNEVIAIGTPKGLSWSVSKGIISAVRDTRSTRYIQTDAAVNSGNSGGPLIDLKSGRVIGVNTLAVRKDIAEGLNFAISSEDVLRSFPNQVR